VTIKYGKNNPLQNVSSSEELYPIISSLKLNHSNILNHE